MTTTSSRGRHATAAERAHIETDAVLWVATMFPDALQSPTYGPVPLAAEQLDFWQWTDRIRADAGGPAFVGVWPRGRGKSTSVEIAAVKLGAERRRRYCWYVSETQNLADGHVQTIGGELLESSAMASFYPAMSERHVGKFGNPRGWRRDRMRTRSGFVVDALGLDTAARGVRVGFDRPDLIVFDDIDDPLDTERTITRKLTAIQKKILPAGADNLVVIVVQNLVHDRSIVARIIGQARGAGSVDFLRSRVVSGPVPAVDGMRVESDSTGRWRIVAGTATWEGQPLEWCETKINEIGPTAFDAEYNHKTRPPDGGMFNHLTIRTVPADTVPPLRRVVCWVDPAVTDTDQSDSQAIQVDGADDDGVVYRLWSWEQRGSPRTALELAIVKAAEYGAQVVGVETDQGGDTWHDVFTNARDAVVANQTLPANIRAAAARIGFTEAKAGAGHGPKVHRASLMVTPYELGRIVHVAGTTGPLDQALARFPLTKPHDLVDASYWSWWDLTAGGVAAALPADPDPAPDDDPYAAPRRSALGL